MSARIALETTAARLVGRLSRATGRGGGTTLPGKLVWKLDPGALDLLAARLEEGVALVSATNGKTTATAMASAILSPLRRLAWNRSGANLASGVTSTLLAARDALVAGPTGREHLEHLVDAAHDWLAPGGALVLELAPHQADRIATAARDRGYEDVEVHVDLAGRQRVLTARRPA